MVRGHRPRAPGRDGARVQPVGRGDARDVEWRGDHVGAGAAQRRRPRGRGDRVRPRASRHPVLLGATRPVQPPQPRRPLLRPDLRAAPGSRLRVRDARVHGAQRADRGLRPLRHVHRVAHRRAPARGAVRAAVDDRARRFERFPRLRIAYMEAGLRLAARAGCTASTSTSSSRARPRRPSSRCRPPTTSSATAGSRTECDDRFVADVIRWMGDDHIVFETDFPHPDSKYPKATDHFLGARARPRRRRRASGRSCGTTRSTCTGSPRATCRSSTADGGRIR